MMRTMNSNLTHVNSSIVFLVQKPNPSIFTQDFLEDKDILSGYEIIRDMSIPIFVQYLYSSGYAFEAVENRIKVELNLPSPQSENTSLNDELGDAASKLVRQIAFMRFSDIGVNFRFLLRGTMSLQAFASPLPSDPYVTQISYQWNYSEYRANNVLALVVHPTNQEIVVQADCNFHRSVEDNAGKNKIDGIMNSVIESRAELFAHAKEALGAIRF